MSAPSGLSGGMLAVRFIIQLRGERSPSVTVGREPGLIHAQTCNPAHTLGDIKTKLWTKKGFKDNAADYRFKLANSEYVFQDEDPFAYFLFLAQVFRESETKESLSHKPAGQVGTKPDPKQMLECVLIHREDLAQREKKAATTLFGAMHHSGPLTQRVEGTFGASWKHKFGVIHDMGLYLFDSEDSFNKKGPVSEYTPLGSVIARAAEPLPADREKHPFMFEVIRPSQVAGTIASGPSTAAAMTAGRVLLYCESESDLHGWIAMINRLYLRRLKLIVAMVVNEMDERGFESEGLFRISANKHHVEELQSEFDCGSIPDLSAIRDEHVLTGILKTALRGLPDPLLTYNAYPNFLRIVREHPPSQGKGSTPAAVEARVAALRDLITRQLPESNQGLLEFLMTFLARVADRAETNKMTSQNLSIVFTPNILRPRVESVESVVTDAKNVLEVTEQLITQARTLWPHMLHTRRSLRLCPSRSPQVAASSNSTAQSAMSPLSLPAAQSGPPPALPAKAAKPKRQSGGPPPLPTGAFGAPPPASVPPPNEPSPIAMPPEEPVATPAGVPSVVSPIGGVRMFPMGDFSTALRKTHQRNQSNGPPPLPSGQLSGPPPLPSGAGGPPPLPSAGASPGPPPLPSITSATSVPPPLPTEEHAAPPPLPRASTEPHHSTSGVEESAWQADPSPAAASSTAVSATESPSLRPSFNRQVSAVQELPSELFIAIEETNALGNTWVEAIGQAQRDMAQAMEQLLAAHTALRDAGTINRESAIEAATTVQSCMEVLASNIKPVVDEYQNLIVFVQEQCRLVKPKFNIRRPGLRRASTTRPTRAAALPPPMPRIPSREASEEEVLVPAPQSPVLVPAPVSNPAPSVSDESVLPQPAAVPAEAASSEATEPTPVANVEAAAVPAPASAPSESADDAEAPPAAAPVLSVSGGPVRVAVGSIVEALYAYEGGEDSMSLAEGERLELLEGDENNEEWWCGRRLTDDEEGYFPSSFVQAVSSAE